MLITRKVEFSASHCLRNKLWSDEENFRVYGREANLNGHGHNYVVEVTLAGTPDAATGMVMDLKELKEILNDQILEPFDHRFLNYEVAPFDRIIPTAENVAVEIWSRLHDRVEREGVKLHGIRLWESPDLYVDYYGEAVS